MDVYVVSIISCVIGLLSFLISIISFYYGHSQLVFNFIKTKELARLYIKNTNRWAYYNLKVVHANEKELIYTLSELPSQKEIQIDFPCIVPTTITVSYQARLLFFIKLPYKQNIQLC